jgi:hypothetical protein
MAAVCGGALALLTPTPADAAWDNVFQVCCNNCRKPVVSNYSDPCCPQPQPCPPQCTTRYVQRCYYQPVTTYRTSFYLEPVTTYRTSYFYEPVTTYRYSCYFDPCTCSYQQVATPCTSYRLRSQCCPVTTYLKRCCVTPVTTQVQMFYWVPQTTCCQTTEGAPIFTQPQGQQFQQQQQFQPQPQVDDGGGHVQPYAQPQPSVEDGRQLRPQVDDGGVKMPRQPQLPYTQGVDQARPPRLGAPEPWKPTPPPEGRKDKVVSRPDGNAVEGRVVAHDRAAPGGARVVFVSVGQERAQHEARADASGNFRATLPAGKWRVYTVGANGEYDFQQTVEVGAKDVAPITLVKR